MDNRLHEMLFGPYGADSLVHAGILKNFGVNAVWFHGFDKIAFSVCESNHMAACVEFKTFRADFEKNPELIPIGIDGRPIRYGDLVQGICLSNKDFLAETEFNLLEGIKQFSPKGIWLDYLTYAGWFETPDPDLQESCFCRLCLDEFCETSGIDADDPVTILHQYPEEWKKHKCDKIAAFAMRYSELIHQAQPDCIVGAYMCPWRSDEYDGAISRIFAQDYVKLADSIDVFTPLIYTSKSGRTYGWGKEFLEGSGSFIPDGKNVQLILDYQDFPKSLEMAALSDRPSWGIQMFSGGRIFHNPEQSELFMKMVLKIKQAAGCQ